MRTVDSLLATYRDAAREHASATQNGGSKRANRAYEILRKTYLELDRLGQLARLLELLDDDVGPQLWAASHLLHSAPEQAEPILRQLSHRTDILGMSASMTLFEWKGGRLRPPK